MTKHIVYVVGDGGVGKTTFLYRAATGMLWDINHTIGIESQIICFESLIKNQNYIRNIDDKFVIRDYGGQRQFFDLLRIERTNPDLIFFCFSLNNFDTFLRLYDFLELLDEVNIHKYILGMKKELPWDVNQTEIDDLCNQYNCSFIPISSFQFFNIYKPFIHFLDENYHRSNTKLLYSVTPLKPIIFGLSDILQSNPEIRQTIESLSYGYEEQKAISVVKELLKDIHIEYDPRYENLIQTTVKTIIQTH